MQRRIKRIISLLLLSNFFFCFSNAQSHEQNLRFVRALDNVVSQTVLLNNEQKLVPLNALDKRKIAVIDLGISSQAIIDSILNKYASVDKLDGTISKNYSNLNALSDTLKYYNTVILPLNKSVIKQQKIIQFINSLSAKKEVVIIYEGKGKLLSKLNETNATIAWYKKENDVAALALPQIIFGGIAVDGKLNKNYSVKYKKGLGFKTAGTRLKFTVPEDVQVNTNDLKKIDSIALYAIAQKATPGMVVLAAKDGKVFFNKAYGTHTYDDNIPDKITDLFDLASVTKITATTPTVMRLYDEGKINLDTTIGYYLERARSAPMNDIYVREVMLHQAGFVPFVPFYKEITSGDYSKDSSSEFPTKVAENYYVRKNYFEDTMWSQMLHAPIKTRGKYVYSDISMYTMQQIVEHITKKPLNEFVLDTFYQPLGMQTAGYLPRNRFPVNKIIPTENDTSFRHQLLIGYVHDEGAALKGGVAGHAGLFASSIDLAIYYQMLLNKGTYGGVQYIKPSTVTYFTGKRSDVSRRGLGFDRADTTDHYPSKTASPETFGHTGFTGIGVWVDPERKLVFLFLSNRVNPNRSTELIRLSSRSKMEDVFDNAVDKNSHH